MSRADKETNQLAVQDQASVDVLLKLQEVCRQAGFGKTTIYAMMKEGTFPEPVKLGPASRWSQLEVQAWIEQQKAARKVA